MKTLKKLIPESISNEEQKILSARKELIQFIKGLESGGYDNWDKNKLKAIVINRLSVIAGKLEI